MSDLEARRREMLEEVKASFALEGVALSDADLQDLEPYLRGEEPLDQYFARVRKRLGVPSKASNH